MQSRALSAPLTAPRGRFRPRVANEMDSSVHSPALELQSDLAASFSQASVKWSRVVTFTLMSTLVVATCAFCWLAGAAWIWRLFAS